MCETGLAGKPIMRSPGQPRRQRPHYRRARVILIGDEILAKVDGFVLGDALTTINAGTGATS